MSVYTSLSPSQLKQLLNQYELGELLHFEGIADGIENTNYRVQTTSGHYILTIFEHYTAKDLSYFLDLMAYLRNHGLSAPCPIQDVNQHHLTTCQSKPAAFFNQLPGKSILQPELEHCRQIGKALAQLHLIGQQFPLQRNNEWGFHWAQHTGKRFINTFIGTSESTQLNQDDKQLLSDELLFQKEFQQSIQEDSLHQPLPQGIIHADLFCDNVLFDNNQLSGILDFYTACNGYLLYDLAITVNAWCIGTDNYLDPTKAKTMIEAYEQLRPLTQNEQHHWSTLLRAAGLRFWLSRLLYQDSRKEAELTQDKDPDVLKCLLLKHRENVTFCQSLCFK